MGYVRNSIDVLPRHLFDLSHFKVFGYNTAN